jgi:glycosyltransferase involved in cell wall biosynthesis
MPQIKTAFVESMLGPETIFPLNWIKYCGENLGNKLKCIYDRETNIEVIKQSVEDIDARKKFGIPKDKFVILFFGRLIFSKGLDLLADAINELNDDYFFLIQGVATDIDFKFDPKKKFNKKNVKYFSDFLDNKDLPYLYNSCDITILPHRRSYTYGSTGIPYQSAMLGKPCIFPNIYPLNELARKYKLGPVYECENINSMVEAIKYSKKNYFEIKNEALFNSYLKCVTTIENMSNLVVE